jgi:hypothetical protein
LKRLRTRRDRDGKFCWGCCDRQFERSRRGQEDTQRHRSHRQCRRGARHHGTERLGQEHARAGARRPRDYEVTGGSVSFEGRDLLALAPEERARAGLFLGFQYPVEIPGVNNVYLLKAALNAKRKAAGEPEVDAYEFLALVKQKMKFMQT